MNYNVSSSYLRFEQRSDSLPVTWKYSGEDQSSDHWNEKLCTFSSSGDTLYFTIDKKLGLRDHMEHTLYPMKQAYILPM